jgi:hypothetical protein
MVQLQFDALLDQAVSENRLLRVFKNVRCPVQCEVDGICRHPQRVRDIRCSMARRCPALLKDWVSMGSAKDWCDGWESGTNCSDADGNGGMQYEAQ